MTTPTTPTPPTEPTTPSAPVTPAPVTPGSAPTSAEQTPEHMIPKSRLDEVLAKQHTAEAELLKLREDQAQREQAALAEQGKWKELAEARALELKENASKLAGLDSIQETLKETLTSALKELSEDARKLVPTELNVEQQLKWVATNRAILKKSAAPTLGGNGRTGGTGGGSSTPELTDEQKQMAKKFGMTLEDYAQYDKPGSFTDPGVPLPAKPIDKE